MLNVELRATGEIKIANYIEMLNLKKCAAGPWKYIELLLVRLIPRHFTFPLELSRRLQYSRALMVARTIILAIM